MERYDVAIIGSGPGGYVAALYAARMGKKTAVIEKAAVGGTCLNKGCIPTKALLSSIEVLARIKEGPAFGIEIGSYKVDFAKIISRKDEIVTKLRNGLEALFKSRKISLIRGTARLAGVNAIDVSGSIVESDNIIIATGSRPLEIPPLSFDHKDILSSDDILELKEIPKALIIVGAGAIGCEFAVIYNALGCRVSVVEMAPEILPNMDSELAKKLGLILKKKGIEIFTGEKVAQFKASPKGIAAVLSSGKEISADKALVAVGRRPNSDIEGLRESGIAVKDGKISTDEYMRTNIPNIYAIGDAAGRFQLAHAASYEAVIACENILGNKKKADYKGVPNCVYTEPEVASVGLSQQQAVAAGIDVKIAKFPVAGLAKAHILGRTEGFIKVVGDKKTGRVLGVHIMGADATNLIAEAALAINMGATAGQVAETIHAHPTLSEGLMETCAIFQEKGIYSL